jgi:hypothetical protein
VIRGLPDTIFIISLIVKLIFIGFDIVTFSQGKKGGVKMEEKLFIIKQDKREKGNRSPIFSKTTAGSWKPSILRKENHCRKALKILMGCLS